MTNTLVEPNPRRWLILAICCSSLLIVSMDVSIVNVALPSIRRELGADVAGLQWTVDSYTLVIAVLLILSGSIADRFGRRRTFQLGLLLFTIGSLLCSVAPSLGWLIVFRMVQAVGGSMMNPVALSIVANSFPDARERARALGFWGGVVGVSLAAGPVVGGILVSSIGWRSIFWINVPIGIAAIILTQVFVPGFRATVYRRLDPAGQLLVAVILGSLVYAIIEGPGLGWSSPIVISLFALSALSLAALVILEQRIREPLIDLRFFRSAPFSGAALTALVSFGALAGYLFLNTLYLQDVRGYSPLHAGLLTLPLAGLTAVIGPVSGRIVATRGGRVPLVIAGACLSAGSLLLLWVEPATPIALLIVSYVVFGFGFGMVNAPISTTAVSGMPRSRTGVAAAIASTGRQTGSALGVAIIGSLVAKASTSGTGFTTAAHAGWAVIGGFGLLVIVIGLVSTGRWARGTAARIAHLLEDEPSGVSER